MWGVVLEACDVVPQDTDLVVIRERDEHVAVLRLEADGGHADLLLELLQSVGLVQRGRKLELEEVLGKDVHATVVGDDLDRPQELGNEVQWILGSASGLRNEGDGRGPVEPPRISFEREAFLHLPEVAPVGLFDVLSDGAGSDDNANRKGTPRRREKIQRSPGKTRKEGHRTRRAQLVTGQILGPVPVILQ